MLFPLPPCQAKMRRSRRRYPCRGSGTETKLRICFSLVIKRLNFEPHFSPIAREKESDRWD